MVHETKSTATLGKNLNCAINVYGILMSFILNKHITIFTDSDMYHANYKLPVFPDCQLSLQQSNTQDAPLVLSYVRRAAYTQLINVRYSYFVPIVYTWNTR